MTQATGPAVRCRPEPALLRAPAGGPRHVRRRSGPRALRALRALRHSTAALTWWQRVTLQVVFRLAAAGWLAFILTCLYWWAGVL